MRLLTFGINAKDMDKHENELRQAYGDQVESRLMDLRAGEDDMVVEGYAARFNETTNLGHFNERIAPGAFDNVLENDVRFLLNHAGMPMARTTNGSLELKVKEEGLYARAVLNETQQSRDTYEAIKRGDISQMSFAFTIAKDKVDRDSNTRTVTEVKQMYDVSAVAFPAYPTTTLEARSAFAPIEEPQAEQVEEPAEQQPEIQQEAKSEVRNLRSKQNKNMNLNDLKGQRAAYYEEFVAIGKLADEEGRAMTEAEQERADTLDGHIEAIDQKIKHKQREQEMVKRVAYSTAPSSAEQEEVKATNYRFSLSRAVNAIRNHRQLEGAEAEWKQEADREYRASGLTASGHVAIPAVALRNIGTADDFQAQATGDGSGFVPTTVPSAIEALRAPTVLERLGVQTFQATGNIKFPRVSVAASVYDLGETSDATLADMELDEVNLQPRRAASHTSYSKQLLTQGGPSVDALIASDLRAAMAQHIDEYGLDTLIMGDSNVNDVSTSGGSTSISGDLAVSMEAKVLEDGADLTGASYVMSPYAYQLFKTTALVNSVNALFENGRFNGYTAFATPHLSNATSTRGKAIFGNFRQGLLMAFFGGIDILVDPFSKAETGQVQLHANRFYDVDIRQPGALCICEDVVAAS